MSRWYREFGQEISFFHKRDVSDLYECDKKNSLFQNFCTLNHPAVSLQIPEKSFPVFHKFFAFLLTIQRFYDIIKENIFYISCPIYHERGKR